MSQRTRRILIALAGLGVLFVCSARHAPAGVHNLQRGETLWSLSRTYYGDPSFHRDLQRINNIADPRKIPDGTPIKLPSRETMQAYRNAASEQERQQILAQDPAFGGPGGPPGGGDGPAGGGQGNAGTGTGGGGRRPAEGAVPYNPLEGLKAQVSVPTSSLNRR